MKVIDNVKYFWKDLPNWAKGVVVVGGVAIGYIVGNSIYKRVKQKQEEKKANEDVKQVVNELKQLQSNGINPTLTETDFKQLIDAILVQFEGCDPTFNSFGMIHSPKDLKNAQVKRWYSNSGQAVYNFVDRIKNDADFLAMAGYWGKQTYRDCFEDGWVVPKTTATFTGAVNKELQQTEIEALNTLLAAKGITKRFF